MIIQGDGTDSTVIETENLLDTDAFIALTNRDEENLLMAMTAQRAGVSKVIAKMNRLNYIAMMREFGVDSIISPKEITANQITAYVRAIASSEAAPWSICTSCWAAPSRRWSSPPWPPPVSSTPP